MVQPLSYPYGPPLGKLLSAEYTGRTKSRKGWFGRVMQVEKEYICEHGSYKRWRDATLDDVQAMGWQIMEKDKQ